MDDYRERLHVPLVWWLLAVPTVFLLGATLYAGLPDPWPIIIMVVLAGGCTGLLITMGLATVEVGNGVLQTGNTSLPLSAVSEAIALDEKQSTRLRGPRADPSAYTYSRPYLKESVYLALDRAAGPTVPYWLVGTRHPAELAAIIERSRLKTGHEPVA
jgi:hypothetical protein